MRFQAPVEDELIVDAKCKGKKKKKTTANFWMNKNSEQGEQNWNWMFLANNFEYAKRWSRANKLFTLLKCSFVRFIRTCELNWLLSPRRLLLLLILLPLSLLLFFFFVGGVANGVIKWNLQFLSVYRFYLCGYQKYYKCRNHTVVFDLEFIWSVGSIFPNWFFVGYRRSTARTNNIEMKNRRTKLQTINSDENMKIEWNQQTSFAKVEGTLKMRVIYRCVRVFLCVYNASTFFWLGERRWGEMDERNRK